jgi:uncharacterized protein
MALRFARALISLALLGFAPLAAAQELPVPPLAQRVTDQAGLLDAAQRARLEDRLAAFEARKGSQIAVLIVPSTQPETIEQFGIRVAEQWKLGRKGVDDGAILLVARDDRALRIEVGYGLEGALPDVVCKRIIEDVIVPRFKLGDFAGGIDAGVDAMIKVIDGEPLPEPKTWTTPKVGWEAFQHLLVIGFVLIFVGGGVLRAMFGRFPAAALIGGATGLLAWALVSSVAAAVIAALVAFVFTLAGGMPGLGGGRGGWGGGLPGGGGGSGGGGWGGGGGGFGGGGASGRW